ncbi:MAG: RNA-binding S4 domain-containing protein [Pseudomonadota bacterium]
MADETSDGSVRLDVWLWRARFYKTRKLSAEQITKRGVRISRNAQVRRTNKPGTTITVGDVVTFGKSVHIRSVEVLAIGERRGPSDEAKGLYRDWEDDL